jgi:uncharacterized protein YwgA
MELRIMREPTDLSMLLFTLGAFDEPFKGRKRLQKTICILKYGNKMPYSFEFKPYFYGPYSETLAEALEFLRASGLVKETTENLSGGIRQYDYELTEYGRKLYAKLSDGDGKAIAQKIKVALASIMSLPTNDLVRTSKHLLRQTG